MSLFETTVQFSDDSIEFTSTLNSGASQLYSLSEIIQGGGDIHERIAACEQSFKFLPDFVKKCLELDGDLPPVIPCRDYAPDLYMKIGQWDKAEASIRYCISIGAYHPASEGEQALENFQNYKKIALKIIDFLKINPGFLQKNIYKAVEISDIEKSDAKHFCRYSLLLRKEPYGKTNKLYLEDLI